MIEYRFEDAIESIKEIKLTSDEKNALWGRLLKLQNEGMSNSKVVEMNEVGLAKQIHINLAYFMLSAALVLAVFVGIGNNIKKTISPAEIKIDAIKYSHTNTDLPIKKAKIINSVAPTVVPIESNTAISSSSNPN
jgi:hypothetical protein